MLFGRSCSLRGTPLAGQTACRGQWVAVRIGHNGSSGRSFLPVASTSGRGCDDASSQDVRSAEQAELPRRLLLLSLGAGVLTAMTAAAVGAESLCSGETGCSSRRLSGEMAAFFTGSVYKALKLQAGDEEASFQKEVFQLRDREYKYFLEANKDKLPRIPDLSDMTGGLSNPLFFNFLAYIIWKVVAKRVKTAEARTAFCTAYGQELLSQVWPEGPAQARAAAAAGGASDGGSMVSGRASEADALRLITELLDRLEKGSFMTGYQVVWGEVPGGWPADWYESEPRLMGSPPSQGPASGLVFQLKLRQPADIEGSVALRAEEDGFWSRAVSGMVSELMRQAGYGSGVDQYFYQDSWKGPKRLQDRILLFFGDPLEQVDVPWVPESLIQNWSLQ